MKDPLDVLGLKDLAERPLAEKVSNALSFY